MMELLTVEEFAEHMKISRSTVFDWIRRGTLKAGRHYIKVGRVIRFEARKSTPITCHMSRP